MLATVGRLASRRSSIEAGWRVAKEVYEFLKRVDVSGGLVYFVWGRWDRMPEDNVTSRLRGPLRPKLGRVKSLTL